jgi:hypothetical protein
MTFSAAFASWMNLVLLNFVTASSNVKADINVFFKPFGRDDTRYAFNFMAV